MGSDAWVPVTPYHTCLSFVAFNLPPVIDMKSWDSRLGSVKHPELGEMPCTQQIFNNIHWINEWMSLAHQFYTIWVIPPARFIPCFQCDRKGSQAVSSWVLLSLHFLAFGVLFWLLAPISLWYLKTATLPQLSSIHTSPPYSISGNDGIFYFSIAEDTMWAFSTLP